MDHSSLKDLVEFMAKSLVDNPDDVEVSEVVGEQTTVVELKVAKEDLGKVIGKQGRTARSMRTILNAASTKLNTMREAGLQKRISLNSKFLPEEVSIISTLLVCRVRTLPPP